MMQVMRVSSSLVRSSFISPPVIQSDRASSYGQSLTCKPHSLILCQLDSNKSSASSAESSRRSLMIATAALVTGAAAAGFVAPPDSAQAAGKRKPPPATEEKKADEEKYLSAYDAKKLANIRRKEALQVQLEAQKAKAKVVREPAQAPLDIFGQRPEPEQSPVPQPEQPAVEAFSQVPE